MSRQEMYEVLGDPSLASLLELLEQAASQGLRVSLPGVVEKYDSTTHLANVKPTLRRVLFGGADSEEFPVIPQVPIAHPRSAGASVILPIQKGDLVQLIFSDRALDRWKYGGGASPVAPDANRAHDLTDCWAIPGGYPAGAPFSPQYPGALEVQLAAGTPIAVTNGNAELIDLLDQLLTAIQQLTVSGNLGYPTGTPVNGATFANIQTLLQTFKAG